MSHRIPTCIAGFSLLTLFLVVSENRTASAIGGGRMAGARPGGGGGHPGANRSPAMSRPANAQRPGGGNLPHPGGGNVQRPGGGNLPHPGGGNAMAKPGGGFQRPSTLPGHTAGANRPNLPGGGDRPNLPGNIAGKDRPNLPGNIPGKTERPNLPGNIAGKDRPNLPGGGDRPAALPGNIAGKDRPNLPGQGNRPNFPNRPGGGPSSGQLNDFLGGGGVATRPGAGGAGTQFRPGDRFPNAGDKFPNAGNRLPNAGEKRPGVVVGGDVNIGNKNTVNNANVNRNNLNYASNKQAWVDNRHATGNVVRGNAGNRYWNAYNGGGYRNTWGGAYGGYNYNRGWAAGYAWGTFNTAAYRTFLGPAYFPAVPVYYAYGTGGNVYYENNTVYVNDQPAGTPEQFYQQAQTLVAAAPEKTPEQDEWMPLGVFALSREDVEDSQMTIELAVNKQGVIAGTYYNEATGISRPLKGTMDVKTQRTAIGFADGRNPEIVLETGVANLTEDEAPALLHKGKDVSDPVMLVRLKKPEGAK